MRHTVKRGLSLVLAVCMVLGLVVLPGVTEAKAEGESLLSTPVYSHAMDSVYKASSTGSGATVPTGWKNNDKYCYIQGSVITEENQNYYQMIKNNTSTRGHTFTYYAFVSGDNVGTNAVLKYRVMIDNAELTGWEVYLPGLANSTTGRSFALEVLPTQNTGVYTLKCGTKSVQWNAGQWYDVEIVVSDAGTTWAVYVNGDEVNSANVTSAMTNKYINAGMSKASPLGTKMCIDNLEVYTYVADAELSAAQDTYTVGMNETISNIWSKTAGAYLPSITFTSSNEDVATVDANGVVTTHSFGEATITATPAASTGMTAVSVTVAVENPNDPVSEPLYENSMDELEDGTYYPKDFAQVNDIANKSSIKTDSLSGRTYYDMRFGTAASSKTNAWAFYTNANIIDNYSVLTYSFIVDESSALGSIYLPAFSHDDTGHPFSFAVADGKIKYGSRASMSVTLNHWYDVEFVVNGTRFTIYIDGVSFYSTTHSYNLNTVNMYVTENDGLGFGLDDLKIYNYVAGTEFNAEQESYNVAVGDKVLPVWNKTEGAYLPSVTYTSSNNAIATVDENGVVTGIKDGEVTITATPAASSGMKPATTTVVVGEGTPEFKFSGANLVLQNSLAIRFNVKEELFTIHGYSNPYAVFNFNGQETEVTEYTVADGKYTFLFTGIAPHQMADTVTATLYAKDPDGEAVTSEPVTYSVLQYCENTFGKPTTTDAQKTLLADLLNYGAAAQTHLGETGDLVNAGVAEGLATVATPDMENHLNIEVAVVDDPAATWKSAALVLENAITVRLKFQAESVEGLKVQFQAAGNTWTTTDFVAAGENAYYVYFNGLHAGQMREIIHATVYSGDTAVSNTIAYSIETYAYNKQAVTENALGELVIAMMKYGDSASKFN